MCFFFGLQHVQRLEARNDDRLALVARDPLVGPAASHSRYVARTDKRIDPHVGRIENRVDRRNDSHMVAKDGEVADALSLGAHQCERRRRGGGIETDGEDMTRRSGFARASFSASAGE